MTTSPILLLENVSRVHGHGETAVRALEGVTLAVQAGELVAVMGPSGSGKSTLLNLAGGLDQPTSGKVVVQGEDLGGMSLRDLAALRRRTLGFVFPGLQPDPVSDRGGERRFAAGARRAAGADGAADRAGLP